MMFNIHESIWPSRPSVPKDNFISWCKSNTKFLVTNGKPKTKISNMELVDSVSPRKQKYNINLYNNVMLKEYTIHESLNILYLVLLNMEALRFHQMDILIGLYIMETLYVIVMWI